MNNPYQDPNNISSAPLTELQDLKAGINDSRESIEEPNNAGNFESETAANNRQNIIEQHNQEQKVLKHRSGSSSPVKAEDQNREVTGQVVVQNVPYMSDNMKQMYELLKQYKGTLDERELNRIIFEFQKLANQLLDKDEVLMALYLCVSRFLNPNAFQAMLVRNGSFKDLQPLWYLLFTERNVFSKLTQDQRSIERCQFNLIVLTQALERDYIFILEDLLDGRAPVTSEMVAHMLLEGHLKLLVKLIAVPLHGSAVRPQYLNLKVKT
jgi:hypothetical protein